MASLSNMYKIRNKHLKQLKGKEGTAKKVLNGNKKIKFKPSAISIMKEQERELSHRQGARATRERSGEMGRKVSALTRVTAGPRVSEDRMGLGSLPLTTARLQPLPPVVEPGSRAGPSGTSPLLLLLLGQPVTPPPGIPHADLKCLIH